MDKIDMPNIQKNDDEQAEHDDIDNNYPKLALWNLAQGVGYIYLCFILIYGVSTNNRCIKF